ncbi:MAG: hypothetical protein DMG22_03245 [Acidobacteria bacterium]|nr:MAG: hypothetical protein DMG22_03245 [Acidobacteriota bacterium]
MNAMRICLRIAGVFLIGVAAQAAMAQSTAPCRSAHEYSPPDPSTIVVPPLIVRQVFGRAVVEAGEKVIIGEKVAPGCISLFTDDTHRFVAGVPVDSRGLFRFGAVPPGRYRLVSKSPALCTGNSLIEVITGPAAKGKRGILVHFRIRKVDYCSYADYDRK